MEKIKKQQTKVCPTCKTPIFETGKVLKCPNCNREIKPTNGIAVKIGLTIFVGIIVLLVVLISSLIFMHESKDEKMQGQLEINKEQFSDVKKVLKRVGIEEVNEIKRKDLLDNLEGKGSKAYILNTESVNEIIFHILDGKVKSIRWGEKYFYYDGKVEGTFKDYSITLSEQIMYKNDAEDNVKKLLKSPRTAKFPSIDEWVIRKVNGNVTIISYVDSQNSFGAMIRVEFMMIYDKNNKITSFIFDGEELVK